jgi:hypothetical protein
MAGSNCADAAAGGSNVRLYPRLGIAERFIDARHSGPTPQTRLKGDQPGTLRMLLSGVQQPDGRAGIRTPYMCSSARAPPNVFVSDVRRKDLLTLRTGDHGAHHIEGCHSLLMACNSTEHVCRQSTDTFASAVSWHCMQQHCQFQHVPCAHKKDCACHRLPGCEITGRWRWVTRAVKHCADTQGRSVVDFWTSLALNRRRCPGQVARCVVFQHQPSHHRTLHLQSHGPCARACRKHTLVHSSLHQT